MSKEKIYIFDTTLRDGAQTEGVNFSIDDKNKIAKALSSLGVDYLEGGWPGANTLDTTFFNKPPKLENTILTAFGMTKKVGRSAENDPGLSALLNTDAPAICLVGNDFPTKQIAGDLVFNKAESPGSFSALLPAFFVIPKAVKIVFSNFGGLLKKVVSRVLAPGHPPSK